MEGTRLLACRLRYRLRLLDTAGGGRSWSLIVRTTPLEVLMQKARLFHALLAELYVTRSYEAPLTACL